MPLRTVPWVAHANAESSVGRTRAAATIAGRFTIGAAVALAWVLSLAGCATVPDAALQRYVEGFAQAREASEEVFLQARLDAKAVALHPGNPDDPVARTNVLGERLAAVEARLAALQIVALYNDALLTLAKGGDPAAVAADIGALRTALDSFKLDHVAVLTEKLGIYGEVIAGAITLVDDLIRQRKFRQAVAAADPAIETIVEVLAADATMLGIAQDSMIGFEQAPVVGSAIRLRKVATQYIEQNNLSDAFRSEPELVALLNGLSAASTYFASIPAKIRPFVEAGPPALGYKPLAPDRRAQIIATLTPLFEQFDRLAAEHQALAATIAARQAQTDAYTKLLGSVRHAHQAVRTESEQVRLEAAAALARRVLELREAAMAARRAGAA